MRFRVVLLLLFLVREWDVAEADCSKKLYSNATGITFTNCNSKKINEEGKTTQCKQTCVFEGKRCALFKVPDDVEYIEIVNIAIPTCAKVTIENIVDTDGKCVNLTLGTKANGKRKITIQLKSPGGEFKVRATVSSVMIKFMTIKNRPCAKTKMPSSGAQLKRIVNGQKASAHEFPFIVSLIVYYSTFVDAKNYSDCNKEGWVSDEDTKSKCCNNTNLASFLCGGSILNKDWILTAQHCVLKTETYKALKLKRLVGVLVRAGDHNIGGKEEKETRHWVIPDNIKRAEHFNVSAFFNNDVALLKVNTKIELDEDFRFPICLPPTYMDNISYFDDCAVQAAGWGDTETGSTSDVLMKGDFTVVNNTSCKTKYAGAPEKPKVITDRMMCTDHKKTVTCRGDSGGPVFFKSWSKHFYQVGVISFGQRKTTYPYAWDNTFPDVNARVTKFIDWIKDNVGAENLP